MCFSLGFSQKKWWDKNLGAGGLFGEWSQEAQMRKRETRKGRNPVRGVLMSRRQLGLNAPEIRLRNYISQNHHTRWYGSRSTSCLLTKRDSLGTLTPLYFQPVLACGSIQMDQGKNSRTSITSPTLSSSLTSLSTARSVQYPSSYS